MSLDGERTWFRFHQLFTELLRLELRRTAPADVPELHRVAAHWLAGHGEPAEAIRHLQAAGDWMDAAQLLADHSFSLILDGRSETIQSLLHAFPMGALPDDAELALANAMLDIVHGRLDEATARVELAERHVSTTLPERQYRLKVAIASLKLELGTRRGDFANVIEQANVDQLSTPANPYRRSNEDIALGSDLRAFALMVLGIAETWTLRHADAERHLLDGASLAHGIGRAYLEATCLARVGFASTARGLTVARRRCEEAVAFAERHGWGSDRVIAFAMATLADILIWAGEFTVAREWLARAARVGQADPEPATRLLMHIARGMLHVTGDSLRSALEEFSAAERIQSFMMGENSLSGQVTGWTIATKARLGMFDEAHAACDDVPAERARFGEIRNASAVIRLAEGDPTAALDALQVVLDGENPRSCTPSASWSRICSPHGRTWSEAIGVRRVIRSSERLRCLNLIG